MSNLKSLSNPNRLKSKRKSGSTEFSFSPTGRVVKPECMFNAGKPRGKTPWTGAPVVVGGAMGPRALVVDFGREVGGNIRVLFGAVNNAPVRFFFSESLEYLFPYGDRLFIPQELTLVMGSHVYRGPGHGWWRDPELRGGFRYLLIRPKNGKQIEILGLELELDFYVPENGEYKGGFLCSDADFNRIWHGAAYTIQVATKRPWETFVFGHSASGQGDWVIMDGAKRDRAVWSMDLAVSIPSFLLSIGDPKVVRDSLITLLDLKNKALFPLRKGYIPHSSFPPDSMTGIVNSLSVFSNYVLWWIRGAYSYYLHSGDREFIKTFFSSIVDGLKWFETQTHPSPKSRTPLFFANGLNDLSWDYTVNRIGFPAATNLLWAKTLEEAASLALDVMSDPQQAQKMLAKAQKIRAAVFETGFKPFNLFDPKPGRFLHTTLEPRPMVLEANAYAVLFDFVTGDKALKLLDLMARRLHVGWGSLCNNPRLSGPVQDYHNRKVIPCITSFEVAALMKYGRFNQALDLTRKTWMPMLSQDPQSTFWEWTGDHGGIPGDFASLCHPWSSGILQILTQGLTGISPTAPGFTRFALDPAFAADDIPIKELEFRIPTPFGPIQGCWERSGKKIRYELDCPEETVGILSGPPSGVSARKSSGKELKPDKKIKTKAAFVFRKKGD